MTRLLRALGIGLLLAVLLVLSLPGIALLAGRWAVSALRARPPRTPASLPTHMSDDAIWLALAIDYPNHQDRSET